MHPLDAAEPLAWRPRIRPRMSDGSNMDEPITGIDAGKPPLRGVRRKGVLGFRAAG